MRWRIGFQEGSRERLLKRVLVEVLMRMQKKKLRLLGLLMRRMGCGFRGRLGWRRRLDGLGLMASGIEGGGGGRREILEARFRGLAYSYG